MNRVRLTVIAIAVAAFAVIGTVVAVTTSETDTPRTEIGMRASSTTIDPVAPTSTTAVSATSLTAAATLTSAPSFAVSAETLATAKPRTTNATTTSAPGPVRATGQCNSGAGGAAANRVAKLFCDHRAGTGLAVMRRTAAMDNVAQAWAEHMADAHETPPPHNPNYTEAQVRAVCPACTGWAENVGYWAGDKPDEIWRLWMESQGHRANIEDARAGEFGIGVAYSADGWLWIVHDFARY